MRMYRRPATAVTCNREGFFVGATLLLRWLGCAQRQHAERRAARRLGSSFYGTFPRSDRGARSGLVADAEHMNNGVFPVGASHKTNMQARPAVVHLVGFGELKANKAILHEAEVSFVFELGAASVCRVTSSA